MKDIIVTTEYDLEVAAGDFVANESTAQHVEMLLLSKQGEWKESPRQWRVPVPMYSRGKMQWQWQRT